MWPSPLVASVAEPPSGHHQDDERRLGRIKENLAPTLPVGCLSTRSPGRVDGEVGDVAREDQSFREVVVSSGSVFHHALSNALFEKI